VARVALVVDGICATEAARPARVFRARFAFFRQILRKLAERGNFMRVSNVSAGPLAAYRGDGGGTEFVATRPR
jgi:hypothetical protein